MNIRHKYIKQPFYLLQFTFPLKEKMARLVEIWNDTMYAYFKFKPINMLICH